MEFLNFIVDTKVYQLFGSPNDPLSQFLYIMWIIFLMLIFLQFFFPDFFLNLNVLVRLRRIQNNIEILNLLDIRGRKILSEQFKKYGTETEKIKESIQEIIEYFDIEPVERDPNGILNRLEYILDLTRYRFRMLIKRYVPSIDEESLSTLENTSAVVHAIHYINKIAKHYYFLAKKFRNYYLAAQVEFLLPLLIDLAKNFYRALPATTREIPIGDGIGPLVIANLKRELNINNSKEFKDTEMIMYEGNYMNRNLILLKAKGPAGRVGKPGAAVKEIVENLGSKLNLIITIDAALKLEGEETGEIAQGVGAAIGDPGPEKFKIEESAIKYRIPLIAIIIKQGFNEAISPLVKTIADRVDDVIERVKRTVLEFVPEGGTALIVGIGNTLGIGN